MLVGDRAIRNQLLQKDTEFELHQDSGRYMWTELDFKESKLGKPGALDAKPENDQKEKPVCGEENKILVRFLTVLVEVGLAYATTIIKLVCDHAGLHIKTLRNCQCVPELDRFAEKCVRGEWLECIWKKIYATDSVRYAIYKTIWAALQN